MSFLLVILNCYFFDLRKFYLFYLIHHQDSYRHFFIYNFFFLIYLQINFYLTYFDHVHISTYSHDYLYFIYSLDQIPYMQIQQHSK